MKIWTKMIYNLLNKIVILLSFIKLVGYLIENAQLLLQQLH